MLDVARFLLVELAHDRHLRRRIVRHLADGRSVILGDQPARRQLERLVGQRHETTGLLDLDVRHAEVAKNVLRLHPQHPRRVHGRA